MELEPIITELEGQGLVTGEDRWRVEQAEGGNATRRPMGSLVGAECAKTPCRLSITLLE
jgi:hypothetical protein